MRTKKWLIAGSLLLATLSVLAEKSPEFRVRLSLRDGSTIAGTTDTEKLVMETGFGETKIPLQLLREVQINPSNAVFIFRNEDKLTGRLEAKKMEINSSIGALSVALTNIVRMSISSAAKSGLPDAGVGLVLHYSFAQGGGSEVEDLSGQGNRGVIHGAKFVPDERFGQVLDFGGDEARNYIRAASSASLRLQAGLTTVAWYKTRGGPQQSIVAWADGVHMVINCHANQFGQDGSGANLVDTLSRGGTSQTCINTSDSSANEWHHIAVTYDSSSSRAAVYVDGQQRREKNINTNMPASDAPWDGAFARSPRGRLNLATDGDILVGAVSPSVPYLFFNGQIADLQIYNRALTAEEIAHLSAGP